MTREEKERVLLTTARAFAKRGSQLQYDQLSMDRDVQITSRRRYILPPEAATDQQRLYLDCATFICAAYYNAFGYQLEADVTWDIRDLVEDCVFCHHFTGTESPAVIEAIKAHMKGLLRPGDAVVYSKATNGHIMLYVDEHTYYHCSQAGIPGSYDYKNRRDLVSEKGGMHIHDPRWWFEECPHDPVMRKYYLFAEGVQKIAILRPLNRVGEPTPNALARMGEARDLHCQVTVYHSGGRTAAPGEAVEYILTVRNDRGEAAPLTVSFDNGPAHTADLAAGETALFRYTVNAPVDGAFRMAPPAVTVNGLQVYAPFVLVGKNLPADRVQTLLTAMETAVSRGRTTEEAIRAAYDALGVRLPSFRLWLRDLFQRIDATVGEVFIRREQAPARDMAVYGYFGGTRVLTPEVCYDLFTRTLQLRMEDLQPGDILLCADDHTNRQAYAALYTGTGFWGSFETCRPPAFLDGEAAARWLDTLPGRYVWVLLRPSLN
ncbi:MAG: DUF11 domain-containing protein [Clostridia bacterium]|nr:DUF11 domain-containing protein [Clostridia bacterium]